MSTEDFDKTTQALVDRTAVTRSRVASDIERLTEQLTPARVKDRALDAAERSVESLAARASRRLLQSPRLLVGYVRENPAAGVAIAAGVGIVVWGLARRRHH